MKSVQMLNGLAWALKASSQGKLEGLCVGSFNNCFGKFVSFFNGPGKKAVFINISPATSIYKFK